MGLSSNDLSAADVAAVMGNNGNNNGWNGDGSFWIIILFLFAFMNGNNWGGNNGGGFIPWMFMNSNNDVQRVVDQQSTMNGITTLAASQAQGFANAEVSRCNAQTNILQTLANNQMGMYQALNANQNINNQGFNDLQSAFQNCCCENRLATAALQADLAREAAATRAQTQATGQVIMDKLCQLEMDGIKQNYENRIYGMQNTIDALRAQVNEQNRLASQTAQTAAFLDNNNAQTALLQTGQRALATEIENTLNPNPVPAYLVPQNCCNQQWNNCGCGM